jgi:MarR family transcriptional regulator, transcriptional regulator for hemolysin
MWLSIHILMNFGEEFSLQVMLANKSYHQYLYKFLEQVDVQHHYQIILLLTRFNGKATQKMLCEHLNIEKSNMAAIIDSLEVKGYVTREVNYKDRRGKLVVLTAKATEVIEGLEATFEHFEANITHEITWQEMYNCLRVLKVINNNLHVVNRQPQLLNRVAENAPILTASHGD